MWIEIWIALNLTTEFSVIQKIVSYYASKSILNTGNIPFSGPGDGQNWDHCHGWLFCKETSSQLSRLPIGERVGKGHHQANEAGTQNVLLPAWPTTPGEVVYGLLMGLEVMISKAETPWRSYGNSSFKIKSTLKLALVGIPPREAQWRH